MHRPVTTPWPLRVAGVAGVALLGSADWRLAAVALIGALASRVWAPAARAAVALLAASLLLPHVALALLAMAIVFVPFERIVGRGLLALGLVLAALPSLWIAAQAFVAAGSIGDATSAIGLAHRAGLRNLEARIRLQAARTLEAQGDAAHAAALVREAPVPREPDVELALADLMVATSQVPEARFALARLASASPRAHTVLRPTTAELWARALLRRGHRSEAVAALEGLTTPEAERLRQLARAPPSTPPSGAGPSFSGAIRLLEVHAPPACVRRGDRAALRWTWLVETGFAPGEDDYAFVHIYGPGTVLGGDHRIGGRPSDALVPGERVEDAVEVPIPASAAPGRYRIDLGIYDPGSQLRLFPDDRPEHEAFVVGGEFEVCP